MEKNYKEIQIDLDRVDFAVFYLIGKVISELKNHNVPKKDIDSFSDEVFSIEPDYYKVLDVCRKWVKIKNWIKVQK